MRVSDSSRMDGLELSPKEVIREQKVWKRLMEGKIVFLNGLGILERQWTL